MRLGFFAVFMPFMASSSGLAQETIQYTYDSRGRLVSASSSGTVNDGKTRSICYDAADNRTKYLVGTEIPDCASSEPGQDPAGGGSGSEGSGYAQVSANNAIGVAGNPIEVTISSTGGTESSYSVDYSTAYGTAGEGSFTPISGTLSFSPSETSKTVTIQTSPFATHDTSVYFYFQISNPTGQATVATSQSVVSILSRTNPCPAPCYN